jgi:heptosyltransferase-2
MVQRILHSVKEFGFYPFRENDRTLEVSLYCRPCSKHGGKRCPEKHFRCMRLVTPEMAFNAVNSIIESRVFDYVSQDAEFDYVS